MQEFIIYDGWCILTKTNCSYCDKVKKLLEDIHQSYSTISCDQYLKNEITKTNFLKFIKSKIGYDYKYFPMVFHNQRFIGGFNETQIYLISNMKTYDF